MTMFPIPANSLAELGGSRTQMREEFLAELLVLAGDTRILWLPKATDTTTSIEESLTGGTFTYDATIAARLSPLGLGYSVSFNGSSQYASRPDAANLSFGTGAADSAFSIVAVANVTDTAGARDIIGKLSGGTTGEWQFRVNASDKLVLSLVDASAAVAASRSSDAAITQGSWGLLGATYTAATGGATAGNDITLYQNGVAVASTAANNASYVALEDTAAAVELGTTATHTSNFFSGSLALVIVCQKNLTASDHWAIKRLVNAYFGLAL